MILIQDDAQLERLKQGLSSARTDLALEISRAAQLQIAYFPTRAYMAQFPDSKMLTGRVNCAADPIPVSKVNW